MGRRRLTGMTRTARPYPQRESATPTKQVGGAAVVDTPAKKAQEKIPKMVVHVQSGDWKQETPNNPFDKIVGGLGQVGDILTGKKGDMTAPEETCGI